MTKNKGAYEQARELWVLGINCLVAGMGRSARRTLQVSSVLVMRTNRREFEQNGWLLAFPSLSYLEVFTGLDEKTIRRAIDDLVAAGFVRRQHVYLDSNQYFLTMPAKIAEAVAQRQAIAANMRKQRRRRSLTVQTPGQLGVGGVTKCPTNPESNPEGNPFTKWDRWHDPLEKEATKEKRLSEEVGNDGASSPNPIFRKARESFGQEAASIVAKAMRDWDRSPEDIRDAIETVRDFGGDARDLAHELWEPDF
jgi:DNA-binding MarR family transcriptional regulator